MGERVKVVDGVAVGNGDHVEAAPGLGDHVGGVCGSLGLGLTLDQALHEPRDGVGHGLARVAVKLDLLVALDLPDLADKLVLGHPLDSGGLLFHLLGVLHRQEVGADKGGAALNAEPLEGLGDAVYWVGVALGIIDGELVHVEAGHVHDKLGLLAPVEDDRAVGASLLVALDVQGVAGEVGVVVGQV